MENTLFQMQEKMWWTFFYFLQSKIRNEHFVEWHGTVKHFCNKVGIFKIKEGCSVLLVELVKKSVHFLGTKKISMCTTEHIFIRLICSVEKRNFGKLCMRLLGYWHQNKDKIFQDTYSKIPKGSKCNFTWNL